MVFWLVRRRRRRRRNARSARQGQSRSGGRRTPSVECRYGRYSHYPPLHQVRHLLPPLVRSLPELRCVELHRPGAGRAGPAVGARSAGSGRPPRRSLLADISPDGGEPVPTGVEELDRVLAGGLGSGLGHPGRRRTRHREVHPPAPGPGRRWPAVASGRCWCRRRSRRRRCAAGPPGSRRSWSRAVAGRGDGHAGHQAAVEEIRPRRAGDRLHPDGMGSRTWTPGRARWCRSGAAPIAWRSWPRPVGLTTILVGHVTKEGTLAGPAGARAPGRHGAFLRRRPAPRPAAAARRQAPLRADGGARAVRDDRGWTARGGRSRRAVPGGPAGRDPGVGGVPVDGGPSAPCWSRSRRSSFRPRWSARAGRHPGSTPAGWRLLLAVLERRAGLSLAHHDVYVSVVGGVRVAEPGADLAVCLALASAHTGRAVDDGAGGAGRGRVWEARSVRWPTRRAVWPKRPGWVPHRHWCRIGARRMAPSPCSRVASLDPGPGLGSVGIADWPPADRSDGRWQVRPVEVATAPVW